MSVYNHAQMIDKFCWCLATCACDVACAVACAVAVDVTGPGASTGSDALSWFWYS